MNSRNQEDDFYIGYQEKMPKSSFLFIRKIILGILLIVIASALLISIDMPVFPNSRFEYGSQTTVKGVVYRSPVPIIKIFAGDEQLPKSILLTNYLKFGATGLLEAYSETIENSLEKSLLQLKGTLIYYDGVTLLELTDQENALIEYTDYEEPPPTKIQEIGWITLEGEIVDSKCFFGAMKPGYGKTHLSCAARCISGGIPPVLAVKNNKENNYFLLLGENGQPIHQEVLKYVAQPIRISGNLQKFDDWYVLFTNPKTDIESFRKLKKPQDLMAIIGCMACSDH